MRPRQYPSSWWALETIRLKQDSLRASAVLAAISLVLPISGKLGAKQLELLKDAVPKIVRVAVLYEAATPANLVQLKEVQAAAPMLKLTVQGTHVR